MWRFLRKRIAMGLLTVFVTTVAVTLLIHLVPGDPVQIMYAQSQGTTPEQLERIRASLGLDRPIPEQYVRFVGRLLQGDLGTTIRGQQPVLDLILQRLPNTLALAVAAMAVALAIGTPIGFAAAYRRGTLLDTALMTVAIAGVSVPHFWLGLVLLFVFAVDLQWLPVAGTGPLNLVLPAVTLSVIYIALIARMTRASVLEVLNEDYIRTARAKGLSERVVLYKHALRNALIPVVTMMGLQFGFLLGGSIVVEAVFNWPGLGRLLVDSVNQRDYPVIQALVLLFSLEFILINLVVDVLYGLINPTIRYK